ncbi:hypothetical protein [Streptacidiphilus neutrinimicus]|uniref:hypothetical protein n=1 Tax=Streptacidiphilus neutrinimicus TaxID=105420 RepID=UPI0005A9F71C|nr:hypothetical protein [Streptacidiphilus neutrinimicus]
MNSSRSGASGNRRAALATSAAIVVLTATAGVLHPAAASAATPPPGVPSDLSTLPASSCAGDTILGDGDVTLYARVSSPVSESLGVDFKVSQHGTTVVETDPANLHAFSGQSAVLTIPRATLETAAAGRITKFDWRVQSSDAAHTSGWSTTCHFSFDPTRPGTPSVAQPGATTIGTPVTLAVSAPTSGPVPAGYQYQLDTAAPVDVKANATGGAAITFTPTGSVNVLTVTSLSPGGNPGGSATVQFSSATPPPNLTDGDLTGDHVPDLVTVGGQHGLPSGLWLAKGAGDGHVATSPADIGVNGNGFNSNGSPSDFDGATVITGRFTAGYEQDVLLYYPSGVHAGTGVILQGNDKGAPLPAGGPLLTDGSLANWNGDNPTQIVNAGNSSGRNTGLPDLLGILGDDAGGYGLGLYTTTVPGGYSIPTTLNVNTPDGTADWNNWTIAATQLPAGGGGTSTALFLWKKSTGELDLWENVTADPNTGATSYTAYSLATGWNTGADVTLQAADINGDGVPDLWTTGVGEQVTANLFSNLSTTGPATLHQVTDTLHAAG